MTNLVNPFWFAGGGGGTPTAPTLIGTATVTEKGTSSTSMTCTMPAGIVAGELLFAYIGGDYAASGASFSTATPGWTTALTHGNSTSDCYQGIMWKIAEGSDVDLVVTSSHSQQMCAVIRRIENADPDNPILGFYNYTGDSKFMQYLFRPRQWEDNCLLMAGFSGDGSDTVPAVINNYGAGNEGWTLDDSAQSIPSSGDGVGISLAFNETDGLTMDRQTFVSRGGITGWSLASTDSSVAVGAAIRGINFDGSAVNLLYKSADLRQGHPNDPATSDFWYSGGCVVTYDQTGMDGTANHASQVLDDNASAQEYIMYPFGLNGSPWEKSLVARFFIKKEGTPTCIPQVQLRGGTTSTPGPSGSYVGVQVETELGTLFEENNTLTDGAYTIQAATGVTGDWWEIVLEGKSTAAYPMVTIYADRSATYGGINANAPTGGPIIGNVELYFGATTGDILGTAPKYNRPDEDLVEAGLLIYDAHNGKDYVVKTGIVPSVTPTGTEAWISPGSGLDGFYPVAAPGNLATPNFTDWAVIDAGQANITVNQRFAQIITSTKGIYVGCRYDSGGNNGYAASIVDPFTANPKLQIFPMVANSFGAAVATVDLATGASTWHDFDMTISCDANEIVASVTFEYGGSTDTKSVTYVSADLNTNTYAMIGMYATAGDILMRAYNEFTVRDYSP